MSRFDDSVSVGGVPINSGLKRKVEALEAATRKQELELAAWRFLAAHRVGKLHVTHVQFVDGDNGCCASTPSCLEHYEGASGATWGEAAIKLAIALGMMPCPESTTTEQSTTCPTSPSGAAPTESSAPTASPRAGAKSKNSPRTRSRKTDSITAATGAAAATDERAEQPLAPGDRGDTRG